MFIAGLGAVFFGLTIGWIAYRILRQQFGAPWISDLIALLGIIAGATSLALFRDGVIFGWYAVGLFIGFFGYFAVSASLHGKQEMQFWGLEPPTPTTTTPPSET